MYKCGEFIDLCKGPHIHSSKLIATLKVTSANYVESKTPGSLYTCSYSLSIDLIIVFMVIHLSHNQLVIIILK